MPKRVWFSPACVVGFCKVIKMKFAMRGQKAGVTAVLAAVVLGVSMWFPQPLAAADPTDDAKTEAAAQETPAVQDDGILTPERIREIAAEIVGDDPDITIDYRKIPADITEAELRAQLTMAKAMSDAFLKGLEGALTESLEADEEKVVEEAPPAPKKEEVVEAPEEKLKKEEVAETPEEKPEKVAAPTPKPTPAPKATEAPASRFEPAPSSAQVPAPRPTPEPESRAARTHRPKAYRTRPVLSAGRIETIFTEEAGDAPQMQPRDFVITLTTTEEQLRARIRAGMTVSASLYGDESISDEEFQAASTLVGAAFVTRARARFAPAVAMMGTGDGLMSAMTGTGDGLMSGTTVSMAFKAAPVPTIDRSRPEGLPEYFSNEYGDAAQRLEDTLSQHPDSAAAHYYLGYAFYMMGNLQRSREGFTRAYEIDPAFTPIAFFTKKG